MLLPESLQLFSRGPRTWLRTLSRWGLSIFVMASLPVRHHAGQNAQFTTSQVFFFTGVCEVLSFSNSATHTKCAAAVHHIHFLCT